MQLEMKSLAEIGTCYIGKTLDDDFILRDYRKVIHKSDILGACFCTQRHHTSIEFR